MTLLRRCAALLCALALFTALSPARALTLPTFTDVPEKHWAAEDISWCAYYGILEGVGDGSFALGAPMTRAAYATALCRMMNWELLHPEKGSFPDNQKTGKWYFAPIETAYAHGVITTQSKLCRPDDPITREEMAMMTVRAFGYSLLAGAVQDDCPFTDVSVGAGYITLAYHMGIVKGIDRYTFNPKATATREEAAAMLLRAYNGRMDGIECLNWEEGCTAPMAESIVGAGGSVPVSPRAGYEAIFAAAKDGDTVALNLVPYAQNVKNNKMDEGRELTQAELDALLAAEGTQVYRSARHGESYLLHRESDGSTTVVWFVSAADLHDKLTLAKLIGLETVYLRRAAPAPAAE
jgi:hypothetical protein